VVGVQNPHKVTFFPIGYVEDQLIQWHYLKKKSGENEQQYTTEFKKMTIMLGISPKNPYVLLKYLGGLHHHIWGKVMFFKPKWMGEACVQAQYLEKIGLKKMQSKGLKQKEKHATIKEE